MSDATIAPAPPADCQGHHVDRSGNRAKVPACPIEFLELRPHQEARVLRLCLFCAIERTKAAS